MKKVFCVLGVLFLFLMLEGKELRVVSLSPAVTELIYALGKGNCLIGRSSACDFPETVKKLPVMGDFARPELEKILRARPDIVLVNDLENPTVGRVLRGAGIKVIMRQCRNLADYRQWLEELGMLLDAPAAAEKMRCDALQQEAELRAFQPSKTVKGVWVVWDSPLMIAGKGSLPDTVMTLAGFSNVAGNVSPEYHRASFEWLLKSGAEYLIWPGMTERKLAELQSHSAWSKVDAVRNGRVIYQMNNDAVQRPGPRIFDGIRQLRNQLLK